MTQHVQIDAGKPTCIGVHYEVPLSDAKRHFESVGFQGVQDITTIATDLNCNEARRRALDAAQRGEGKCYWRGDWDYSANPCALYMFEFTSYDGPRFSAPRNPATEAHVDWDPIEED